MVRYKDLFKMVYLNYCSGKRVKMLITGLIINLMTIIKMILIYRDE